MLSVVLLLSFTAKADQPREHEFDIPQQGIETALSTLATQAGALLLFPYDLVQPVDSKPVSGRYTVEDALAILLEGTGLTGGLTEGGVITISRAGAIDNQGRTTMAQNHDKLNGSKAPTKRRGVLGVLAVVFSAGVGAQDTIDVDEEELRIEEIIVTGTNIRGVTNPTTPVISLDRDELDLAGVSSAADIARLIPQNLASISVGSTNSGNSFESVNNETFGTTINLRGLGAGSTLTLFNGRRLSLSGDGAFFDISTLPIEIIDRVEVLTDGASAIYGADAVAGVVNFITRDDVEGVEIGTRYGAVNDGGYQEYQVNGTAGLDWDSGNLVGNLSYSTTEPLLASEREFIDVDSVIVFPETALTSDDELFSGYLSFRQDITQRLSTGLQAFYSNRESEVFERLFARRVTNEIETIFLTGQIEYALTESLTSTIFFDYGDDNTERRLFNVGVTDAPLNQTENSVLTLETQTSGKLFKLPGGEVTGAVGALYRNQSFEETAATDVDGERDVWAVYGELIVPFVGSRNELPLVRDFRLSLAGRYEEFSDFGGEFTPKIGFFWGVNDDLSLRGNYSEAFRAPTLLNVNAARNIVLANLGPFIGEPSVPSILFAGGNPDLEPETAETWTVGLQYAPSQLSGLKISLDYFDVSYSDRIEFLGPLDALLRPEFSAALIANPDPLRVQEILDLQNDPTVTFDNFGLFPIPDLADFDFILNSGFQNFSARDVSGLDIQLFYSRETEIGDFAANLNGSYLFKYDTQLTDLAEVADQLGELYRPVDLNLRGSLSWTRGGFTAVTAINHTNSYESSFTAAEPVSIDQWTTIDLTLAFDTEDRLSSDVLNGIRGSVSIQNLFDEEPPFVETSDGLNFDPANANALGRVVRLSLSKSF